MLAKLASGYLVKIFSIISTFIFVPLYIKYLGLDNYAVISIGLIISGLMNILDTGLTSTLTREFSRSDIKFSRKQDTFKALETIYLLVLIVLTIIIFNTSEYISDEWINTKSENKQNLSLALRLIGIEAGWQMLMRFYIGGLIGLERQIVSNNITFFWSIFRNGFVIFVIIIDPTIGTFYSWQIASTILFAVISRYVLGQEAGVHFNILLSFGKIKYLVADAWPFASGMLVISIVAALNTQADKIIIARLLQIEELGYYTLAISLAGSLTAIVSPVSSVLLPRFTFLFSSIRVEDAVKLYQNFALLISIATFSVSSNLFFLSYDIMLAWTDNVDIAKNSQVYLSIASISYAMLAIAILPYIVALANGHTKTNNIIGLLSLIFTIPCYYLATKVYGGNGAATIFLLQQSIVTAVYTLIIAKRFMNISFSQAFVIPVIAPAIIIYFVALTFHTLWPLNYDNRPSHLLKFVLSVIGTMTITGLFFVHRLSSIYLNLNRRD
jgi:O-antigen/teichoic acid export membrane protein